MNEETKLFVIQEAIYNARCKGEAIANLEHARFYARQAKSTLENLKDVSVFSDLPKLDEAINGINAVLDDVEHDIIKIINEVSK
jgi:hypothetical protein